MRKKSLKKCAEEHVRVGEIGVLEVALGGVEESRGPRRRLGGGVWGFIVWEVGGFLWIEQQRGCNGRVRWV